MSTTNTLLVIFAMALVVPATVRGGPAAFIAVGTTLVALAIVRRGLPAMALGILAAALYRGYMGV